MGGRLPRKRLFATSALLAAIGAYGVVAYAAAQRRREIAPRLALGASRGRVLGQFFRLGVTLLLAVVAVGALGVWGARRALATLLFGVAPLDRGSGWGRARDDGGRVGGTLLPSAAVAPRNPIELENNSRTDAPKHDVERASTTHQKAGPAIRKGNPAKSAKPPSPVQIRAAPPKFPWKTAPFVPWQYKQALANVPKFRSLQRVQSP
jgi:ABC-type antimicrobial peptide transport system permease subunit